jgi:hypothetical protein
LSRNFAAEKIREIVRDPKVAEKLTPKAILSAQSGCASTPAITRISTGPMSN